jgi:ZIP family zinc transporter
LRNKEEVKKNSMVSTRGGAASMPSSSQPSQVVSRGRKATRSATAPAKDSNNNKCLTKEEEIDSNKKNSNRSRTPSSSSSSSSERSTNGTNSKSESNGDSDSKSKASASSSSSPSKTTSPSSHSTIYQKLAVIFLLLVTAYIWPNISNVNTLAAESNDKSSSPDVFQREATVWDVFAFGWITAVSTGLGVVPLIYSSKLDAYWLGLSNAIAAGMMTAASYSLITEGWIFEGKQAMEDVVEGMQASNDTDIALLNSLSALSTEVRTIIGVLLGWLFIFMTQSFLEAHEHLKLDGLGNADSRKVLLIVFVMTLHSFTEGVGIGVSFGGSGELGAFISASLAVHNVPEGLAVAIVLLPKGISRCGAFLWCVLTSLPQPIMAVPAFLFIEHFLPFLPIGLGFAGGAMCWVAYDELYPEAVKDSGLASTWVTMSLSAATMLYIQHLLH